MGQGGALAACPPAGVLAALKEGGAWKSTRRRVPCPRRVLVYRASAPDLSRVLDVVNCKYIYQRINYNN